MSPYSGFDARLFVCVRACVCVCAHACEGMAEFLNARVCTFLLLSEGPLSMDELILGRGQGDLKG